MAGILFIALGRPGNCLRCMMIHRVDPVMKRTSAPDERSGSGRQKPYGLKFLAAVDINAKGARRGPYTLSVAFQSLGVHRFFWWNAAGRRVQDVHHATSVAVEVSLIFPPCIPVAFAAGRAGRVIIGILHTLLAPESLWIPTAECTLVVRRGTRLGLNLTSHAATLKRPDHGSSSALETVVSF